MKRDFFVGFSLAADWLAAIDKESVVNLDVGVLPGKAGRFGIVPVTSFLMLSQVVKSEVLYLFVPIDRYAMSGGFALDEPGGGDRHLVRAESALVVAQTWLEDNRVKWRRALVSWPVSLRMREGRGEFLTFDAAVGRFQRAEVGDGE